MNSHQWTSLLYHVLRVQVFSSCLSALSFVYQLQRVVVGLQRGSGAHTGSQHHRQGSLLPKVKTGQHQSYQSTGRGSLTSSVLGHSYLSVLAFAHQPHQTPLSSKEKQSQTAYPTDIETLGGIDLYWCKGFTK